MGILFASRLIRHEQCDVGVRIFDVQGTRQFLPLMRSYFRGCDAVVVAYSLIDRKSFNFAKEVVEHVEKEEENREGADIVKYLVATHLDRE